MNRPGQAVRGRPGSSRAGRQQRELEDESVGPDDGRPTPAGAGESAGGTVKRSTHGTAVEVWQFLIVAGLVFASRLLFLGPGYVFDPDAWRVAYAAKVIATAGHYEASRFPGYPVQEFASALLLRGGPAAVCGASALLAAIGAGFLALAFRKLGSRDGVLAALALASAPAVFISSVQAMDYAWALGFALASLYAALCRRPLLAGILLGLGIGCRLPTGAWLLPIALAVLERSSPGHRLRSAAVLVLAAAVTGVLAFVPVYLEYGSRFFRYYYTSYPPLVALAKEATVDLWGIPGTLALVILVPAALLAARGKPARSSIPGTANPLLMIVWGLGIAVTIAVYLRLPLKAFYLIPVVPFALLLLGQSLERRAFLAICVALLVSPWLFKVSQPGGEDDAGFTSGTSTFVVAGKPLVMDWLHGPVVTDQARRRRRMDYVDRTLALAHRLRRESVVVAYDWLPQIRARLGSKVDGDVTYVYLLSAAELRTLRSRGIDIYDLADADWMNTRMNGVSLRLNGVRPLDPAE